MRRSHLVWLAAQLALTACGSRSSLTATQVTSSATSSSAGGSGVGGVGGTGGVSGTGGVGGTGGVAGTGGVGGTGTACQFPMVVSPIVEVEVDPSHLDRAPQFAPASDDGHDVTVVFQERPIESPGPFTEMRHVTFSPWLAWPTTGILGPSFGTYASPQLDDEFAVTGAPGGHIGMLVSHAFTAASFSPRVDPYASSGGPSVGVDGARPVFAARNGDVHLVGTRSPEGYLIATLVRAEGMSFSTQATTLTCSNADIVAGAVPHGDGFLVVSSNGAHNTQGFCEPADPGAPTRIDVFSMGWMQPVAAATGFDAGMLVADLGVAAHPEGAWAVWPQLTNEAPMTLHFVRFAVTSGAQVGPAPLTSFPEDSPFDFAVGAVGRSLAVAYKNDPANNPPDLAVRVIDENGGSIALVTLPDPPSLLRPTSLIGSPSGDSLVVTWEAGGFPSRVTLARIDCVGLCPAGTCKVHPAGPCEPPTGPLGNACCQCGADGLCSQVCK